VTLCEEADPAAALAAHKPISDEATSADGSVVRVSVRSRSGSIVEAVRRLSDAGVDVDDLALRRPTLDDVFLALTGHAAEEDGGAEQERAA
jgi:ABC-2 type transport system ATP-binding protein